MNCSRFTSVAGGWVVLLSCWLLAATPALGQDAPPKPGANTRDPAFSKYVDFDLLAQAWNEKNAGLLTDVALQFAEGERVLLRRNKDISSDQVFAMALKIAKERHDNDVLMRLATVLEVNKKADLAADAALALKLVAKTRSYDPALVFHADQGNPAVFFILQGTLDEIRSAKIEGNRATLDDIVKRIPELTRLSEVQRKALLKEAQAAVLALPTSATDIDPAAAALNKLTMESRNPGRGGRSSYRPPPPRPTYHPPSRPTYRPPPPPPRPTYRPPAVAHRPPPPPSGSTQNRPVLLSQTQYGRQHSHSTPPPPVVTRPSTGQPTTRPYFTSNKPNNTFNTNNSRTTINNTVINNASSVNHSRTTHGLVVTSNCAMPFTRNWDLEPGECIVSIGGMNCADSNLSLQDMIAQAYQNGNLSCTIRTADGDLQTTELDQPDSGDDNGGNGNDGLAGVTMVGSENLGNYGRLEFRFQTGDAVTMIDTEGSNEGRYVMSVPT